jgi:DNA-binding phage protein
VPTTSKKTAFDRYVDKKKKSPTFAAEYERVGAEIRAVDDLIRWIDAERVDLGMSKADLARKVSMTPAAMRRLLTSGEANPTMATVFGVLAAVGLRFTLMPGSASKPARVALTSEPTSQLATKPVSKPSSILSASKPARKRAGDAKSQHRKTA